jgi:uncharacterized cupredoxin-like copper-binding protein
VRPTSMIESRVTETGGEEMSGRFRRRIVVALVAAVGPLAVVVAASAVTTQNVAVTAGKPTELRFTLSKKTVAKGSPVVFTVTNKGALAHDFKIAGKKSALLAPGRTARVRVTFTKTGKFAYLCTVKGHAGGGMKGVITVR